VDTEGTDQTAYISRIATGVHRLSTVLGNASERVIQECCGFGLSQFRVLWVLHTHQEGVQQNVIARWLNLTEAAISRQLQLMKEQGLLTVTVADDDRRSRTVVLTPEGRQFTQNGLNRLVETFAPAFTALSLEQQKQLSESLDTLFYRIVQDLHSR
jgi:DNA-binding MarR family transcriptional regulator